MLHNATSAPDLAARARTGWSSDRPELSSRPGRRRGGSSLPGPGGVGIGLVQLSPVAPPGVEVLFGPGLVDLENDGDLVHVLVVDGLLAGLLEEPADRGLLLAGQVRHDGTVAIDREGDLADGVPVQDRLDLLL